MGDKTGCQELLVDRLRRSEEQEGAHQGLERLMVSHNEKAITRDYEIPKVAFHINNFGVLPGGWGTLAKVRVYPPEVMTLQLGNLPSNTDSKGHPDGALEDISCG